MHSEKWGINKLKEERKRLAGELLIADGKLEAVKKQLFVVPSIHVQDYQRMMRKIKEILEAEA